MVSHPWLRFMLFGSVLLLAACAGSNEETNVAERSDDEALADALKRMAAVETEVATLKIEISRLMERTSDVYQSEKNQENKQFNEIMASDLDHALAGGPIDATASVQTERALPGPITTSSSVASWGLLLASYKSGRDLDAVWTRLLDEHYEVLAGLSPRRQKVEIPDKGTFYRLKAGPFPGRSAAEIHCNAMIVAGAPCVVMDFTGAPF